MFTPSLAQVNFSLEIFYFIQTVLPMHMNHVMWFNLEAAKNFLVLGATFVKINRNIFDFLWLLV